MFAMLLAVSNGMLICIQSEDRCMMPTDQTLTMLAQERAHAHESIDAKYDVARLAAARAREHQQVETYFNDVRREVTAHEELLALEEKLTRQMLNQIAAAERQAQAVAVEANRKNQIAAADLAAAVRLSAQAASQELNQPAQELNRFFMPVQEGEPAANTEKASQTTETVKTVLASVYKTVSNAMAEEAEAPGPRLVSNYSRIRHTEAEAPTASTFADSPATNVGAMVTERVAAEVTLWNTEQLGMWLVEQGLGQYKHKFYEEEMNGEALLYLNAEDLIELGFYDSDLLKLETSIRSL